MSKAFPVAGLEALGDNELELFYRRRFEELAARSIKPDYAVSD